VQGRKSSKIAKKRIFRRKSPIFWRRMAAPGPHNDKSSNCNENQRRAPRSVFWITIFLQSQPRLEQVSYEIRSSIRGYHFDPNMSFPKSEIRPTCFSNSWSSNNTWVEPDFTSSTSISKNCANRLIPRIRSDLMAYLLVNCCSNWVNSIAFRRNRIETFQILVRE